MTGNETHGEGRKDVLSSSYVSLYDVDKLTAEHVQASARAADIAVDVLKGIGSAIKKSGVLKGYPRAAQAKSVSYTGFDAVYPVTMTDVDMNYVTSTSLEPYVRSKPAKQKWLQYVTDKKGQYVFGASIDHGEDEGTYIDETLFENAGKYASNFWKGLKEKARKYAKYFVEAIVTDGHEYDGHYRGGIKSEVGAEEKGIRRLNYLRKMDPAVDFAVRTAA